MFITKLSEVNSCINHALGKQTAPLPRFNSVHSCCLTGLLDPFSRHVPHYVSTCTCNTLLLHKTAWGATSDPCSLLCPTDTRHSGTFSGCAFAKNWLDFPLVLGKSTKVNPPPQPKIFSYLLPTSLSNSQFLCFIRSTAELIPYNYNYFTTALPLMLLSPWATKICNHTTPARTYLSLGKCLSSAWSRARQAGSNRYIRSWN